jgi:hypothetical protein
LGKVGLRVPNPGREGEKAGECFPEWRRYFLVESVELPKDFEWNIVEWVDGDGSTKKREEKERTTENAEYTEEQHETFWRGLLNEPASIGRSAILDEPPLPALRLRSGGVEGKRRAWNSLRAWRD